MPDLIVYAQVAGRKPERIAAAHLEEPIAQLLTAGNWRCIWFARDEGSQESPPPVSCYGSAE